MKVKPFDHTYQNHSTTHTVLWLMDYGTQQRNWKAQFKFKFVVIISGHQNNCDSQMIKITNRSQA